MNETTVFLVDDHAVFMSGVKRVLEAETDLRVVGQASNAQEALDQIETLSPEIILMDIKMPEVDGIQLTRKLLTQDEKRRIIMLSMFDEYRSSALEAGASEYVLKSDKPKELIDKIHTVKHNCHR